MSAFALQRILPVLLASAFTCGSVCAQEGADKLSAAEIEKLDSLRFSYDLQREEITQKQWVEAMEKLRKGYREGMQKVQYKFSQTGDLTNTIAARTAAKADPTVAAINFKVREIAVVQRNFIVAQKKLQKRLDESLMKLARSHVAELSAIKIRLTKLNRLESAQDLERMVNKIKVEAKFHEFENLGGGRRNLFMNIIRPSELRASGCRIKQAGQGIEIVNFKDPGCANTPKHYAPPFRFRFVAMPDSTNIRWHYAKGQVILNWEVDMDELRVRDPKTARRSGYQGRGLVTPKQWHEIVIEVTDTSLRVIVDGKERHQRKGDYKGLNSPIGIGGHPGTKLTVKEISIEKIKATP